MNQPFYVQRKINIVTDNSRRYKFAGSIQFAPGGNGFSPVSGETGKRSVFKHQIDNTAVRIKRNIAGTADNVVGKNRQIFCLVGLLNIGIKKFPKLAAAAGNKDGCPVNLLRRENFSA